MQLPSGKFIHRSGCLLSSLVLAYQCRGNSVDNRDRVWHHSILHCSMPTAAPTHLATALQTWNRLQEIKSNGAIQLDGNSLDIAAVVATAW